MSLTMTRMQSLERGLIAGALVVLSFMAWAYMIAGSSSPGVSLPVTGDGLNLLGVNALMWTVMMIAMMVPGATPMIITYTRVHQQRRTAGRATAPTGLFLAGYLAVWTGSGVLAALAQWALHQKALLSSAMGYVDPLAGAAILALAGAFQCSRLKYACLSKCQSPVGFLMKEWREGATGAFTMGVRHGAFCVGCCWALMLLMFVGGVMSLAWMAGLTLYFLIEKLVPWPRQFSRITGVILMAGGVLVAIAQ
jgi:predicted metal-binding membrane protein